MFMCAGEGGVVYYNEFSILIVCFNIAVWWVLKF